MYPTCYCSFLDPVISYLSEVSRIIEDCKDHIKAISSIRICRFFSEVNSVGYRLTHFTSYSDLDNLWLVETPSMIDDVLYANCCNRARGFGVMSPSMHNNVFPV